jgi:uncharacterized protein
LIHRKIEKRVAQKLRKGKAILVFGARQVGKTTLIKTIVQQDSHPYKWLNGDEADVREMLTNTTSTKLKSFFGQVKTVVIDEAQRIENIGLTLKLITDELPEIQVIATGSSTFELANKINEPLTGRKYEFRLYPFSFSELVQSSSLLEEMRLLEDRLIYGSYPEIVVRAEESRQLLTLLTDSYLFKDVLNYEGIKKPSILIKLLMALALQVGNEVSYLELAQTVGIDKNTVEKYIDILEQIFIIFRVNGFNRSVRTELKKSKKIYFYDNGVLNAILGNFLPLSKRSNVGALWENYVISERKKKNAYDEFYGQHYFWRTNQQQEIDYIEEIDGAFKAFEIKWNPNAKARFPKSFLDAYNVSSTEIIHPKNYYDYLT